jgi:hypothetical protein
MEVPLECVNFNVKVPKKGEKNFCASSNIDPPYCPDSPLQTNSHFRRVSTGKFFSNGLEVTLEFLMVPLFSQDFFSDGKEFDVEVL